MSMHRIFVAALTLVALLTSPFAAAEKTYTIRLAETWGPNSKILGETPRNMAAMAERMSSGRLKFRIDSSNKHKAPFGIFDLVRNGQYDMGHTASYYYKGTIPNAMYFTTIPFGMITPEMYAWFYHDDGMALMQKVYEPYGLLSFPGGNTSNQMGGWFRKEINSLDDLKGLKMRIPGVGGEVFQRAGGTAVTLPGGELYTSLQTGVIDATEWVAPYNDMSLGLHEVARYYYYPGWHEPGPTLEMTVNKKAFESLPKDLQRIVEVAARYANQDMLDEYTARNNAALNLLLDKHDINVKPLPDDVLIALRQASDDYLQEVIASDPMAKKVYQSWKSFLDNASNYHRISEQAYINTRDLESDN